MSNNLTLLDFSDTLSEEGLAIALQDLSPLVVDCRDIEGCGRFCDAEAAAEICSRISSLPCEGLHWIDSGDYHFATLFWCAKVAEPFDLLLFDHHTDMQQPRFEGLLSCGSWVLEMLGGGTSSPCNAYLRNVYMVGVAESLRCETGDFDGRVHMLSEEQMAGMEADCIFSWLASCGAGTLPLYISIDKDALSPADAATNWDQGSMRLDTLCELLQMMRSNCRIIGTDICGCLRPIPASELNLRADTAIIEALK